jgi:hypothetical protein
MNTTTPMRNGELANLGPPEILVLCANCLATVGGDVPDEHVTPEGLQFCRAAVDGILAAARAGGHTQSDILETLLASSKLTPRMGAMAREACNCAEPATLRRLFDKIGLVAG